MLHTKDCFGKQMNKTCYMLSRKDYFGKQSSCRPLEGRGCIPVVVLKNEGSMVQTR